MTPNTDRAIQAPAESLPKTTQFRRLLHPSSLSFIMEAHNGLLARIVEEAGFQGIWASGLSISAATTVPNMVDGDTGYGNFNKMRRLVSKLTQRGIAAVSRKLDLMAQEGSLRDGDVPVLLTRLIAKNHEVRLQYITGQWLDIDDALDLARARNLL